MEIKTTFKMFN